MNKIFLLMKKKLTFLFFKVFNFRKNLLDNKYFVFFQELILFIIGMIICSFFFSARFLKERLPQKIEFIYDHVSFLCFFALYVLFCILISKKLKNKKKTNIQNNKLIRWFTLLVLMLINIYEKSLFSVYNVFIKKSNIWPIMLRTITNAFYYKIQEKYGGALLLKIFYVFFYIFGVFPRFLVTTCFFIDVLIFHKFFYLYKVIWLLIIPFLCQIIFYIIMKYINNCIENVKHYFKITITKNPDNKIIFTYDYKRDSEFVKKKPLTEEYKKYAIYTLMPVLKYFLLIERIFAPEGELKNNKLYKIIIIFLLFIYAIIFGYFTIKLINQELLLAYIIEYTKIMLDNILLFLPPLKVLKLFF